MSDHAAYPRERPLGRFRRLARGLRHSIDKASLYSEGPEKPAPAGSIRLSPVKTVSEAVTVAATVLAYPNMHAPGMHARVEPS